MIRTVEPLAAIISTAVSSSAIICCQLSMRSSFQISFFSSLKRSGNVSVAELDKVVNIEAIEPSSFCFLTGWVFVAPLCSVLDCIHRIDAALEHLRARGNNTGSRPSRSESIMYARVGSCFGGSFFGTVLLRQQFNCTIYTLNWQFKLKSMSLAV